MPFFQLLVNHFGLLKVKSEKGKNVCVAGVGQTWDLHCL